MPLKAKGLGNEDYVAFLDESGDEEGVIVVAGVLIPARWLRAAERRWRDFVRDHLGGTSGRAEVKSRELIRGTGAARSAHKVMMSGGWPPMSYQGAGGQFYRDALQHIASTNEVRVLVAGVKTPYAVDVYRAWFWLAYAALTDRSTSPRPRLPLTVIDGQDVPIRASHDLIAYRFYKAFHGRRYYIGSRQAWFIGGSVLQESTLHPFVQMADLIAGAARNAIVGREPVASWYYDHLRKHARERLRGEIDISRHALSRLRKLDPKDKCGSGHFGILIP